jgi:hypothetical protein
VVVRTLVHRRRPGFWLLLLALLWFACELLAVLAWWLATGSPVWWRTASPARAAAQNAAQNGEGEAGATPGVAAGQAAVNAGIVPHPFFGYVDDPRRGSVAGFPISSWGFVDPEPPLRTRRPDRFVLALVGGSVALQTGHYGRQALLAALGRSPLLRDKTIDLVHLGLGGYRQPQQLQVVQMLCLLGGHFDAVVNLDGFNEMALVEENLPVGVPAWYPRSWSLLAGNVPTGPELLQLGELALLRQQRAAAAQSASSFAFSPLWQFAWWWRDGRRAQALAAASAAVERAAAAKTAATWPAPAPADLPGARLQMARLWAASSIALHALCRARGIVYCHLLQPNQYVPGSKPIGSAEAARCFELDSMWQRAAVDGYPLLLAEVPDLLAAGVDFADLTQVFVDHPEPLYVDACCHFDGRGAAIVAEHIAGRVRTALERTAAPLRQLEVPAAFVVTALPQRVPVVGIAADGSRRDLAGAGLGTSLRASPEHAFVVGADGSLRGGQRGAAGRLLVAHGTLTAEVALTSSWPDEVAANDGIAASGELAPALRLARVGTDATEVVFAGLPLAPFRLLAVGDRPPPASVGELTAGTVLQPIAAAGRDGTLIAPAPLAGRPLFLRAFALAADGMTVVAATNTLVSTRD